MHDKVRAIRKQGSVALVADNKAVVVVKDREALRHGLDAVTQQLLGTLTLPTQSIGRMEGVGDFIHLSQPCRHALGQRNAIGRDREAT